MLLDDSTSKHPAPPGQGGSPKHVLAIVAGVLAVVLVVGAGIVAKQHFGQAFAATANASIISKSAAEGQTGKSGAVPKAFTPPKSWALKFDATFKGSKLNTKVWGTCYPWVATGGCTNFGNTSDVEQEWYLASQDQVSGGALHLVAKREPTAGLNKQGKPKEYACRSGMVTTYPSLRFEYGYVQVTAKVAFGKGLWTAFWLAAANQQWPPEVDIFEHWDTQAFGKVYLHPVTGPRQGGSASMPHLSTGYHTFGLDWTKTGLTWYYDGTKVFSTKTGVPHQAMYLITNLAVDNASPGGCTGSVLIKQVKVWLPPT
jgi:beta-glucanase (GH16 family)